MTGARVISADDVCTAAEEVLKAGLPKLLELLGVENVYKGIREWQQLPTSEALATANFPAIAIASPGLTGTPTRDGQGRYRATWRLAVGVYDRGKDHNDTQARVRDWCSFIRTVLLTNRRLGPLDAESVIWAGEEYRLVPGRAQARTFGGGAVAVDVTVPNVLDLGMAGGPLVLTTNPTLTVR